jgi:hypothetical protein
MDGFIRGSKDLPVEESRQISQYIYYPSPVHVVRTGETLRLGSEKRNA